MIIFPFLIHLKITLLCSHHKFYTKPLPIIKIFLQDAELHRYSTLQRLFQSLLLCSRLNCGVLVILRSVRKSVIPFAALICWISYFPYLIPSFLYFFKLVAHIFQLAKKEGVESKISEVIHEIVHNLFSNFMGSLIGSRFLQWKYFFHSTSNPAFLFSLFSGR